MCIRDSLCNGKVAGHGKAHSAACAGTFDPGNYRLFNLTDVKDQVVEISHIGLSLGRCRDTSCIAAVSYTHLTGMGDFVETSLFGNAVWLCGTMSAFEQYGYHYPKKRSEMVALYTFYKCKDGEWLHLAVTQHDRYWKPLAEALNVPELAEDERFKNAALISRNRAQLIPLLEQAFSQFDYDEIAARLRERDIVFDRMRHYREPVSYTHLEKLKLGSSWLAFNKVDGDKAKENAVICMHGKDHEWAVHIVWRV